MKLPSRLQGLLELVPDVTAVADIGSGDGVLAAALAQRGIHVIATERTPSRVASLRRELAGRGVTADVRLGDGINALVAGEVQAAVVAGLGGRSIVRILDTAGWLPPWLVLQPMQDPEAVADWLSGRGWAAQPTRLEQRGRTYVAWIVQAPDAARRAA